MASDPEAASGGSGDPRGAGQKMPSVRQLRSNGSAPLIFGHRGVSSSAPENTLAAFRMISRDGIPGVELDVHQCATGELVVAHDDSLSRTAGSDLILRQLTLDEIRQHDVGGWFGREFRGQTVPTLDEVFALLGSSVIYDIEIKTAGVSFRTADPGGPEASLDALIHAHGLEGRCLVSSFDPLALRRFARVSADVPIALIYTNSPKAPFVIRKARGRLFCTPQILKPHHEVVTESYVRRHHAAGRQVVPWTVDDVETARRLADCGVDGIITNVPDRIRSAVSA